MQSTLQTLKRNPYLGAHYAVRNPQLPDLRCWPVADFEQFRIYYMVANDTVSLIRILRARQLNIPLPATALHAGDPDRIGKQRNE